MSYIPVDVHRLQSPNITSSLICDQHRGYNSVANAPSYSELSNDFSTSGNDLLVPPGSTEEISSEKSNRVGKHVVSPLTRSNSHVHSQDVSCVSLSPIDKASNNKDIVHLEVAHSECNETKKNKTRDVKITHGLAAKMDSSTDSSNSVNEKPHQGEISISKENALPDFPTHQAAATSESENDILAAETLSINSESPCKVLSSGSERNKSDGNKTKRKKSKTRLVEGGRYLESKKRLMQKKARSKSPLDRSVSTNTTDTPVSSQINNTDHNVSTASENPEVEVNMTNEDIDQNVTTIEETQEVCYDSEVGTETTCKSMTPEIPLQDNNSPKPFCTAVEASQERETVSIDDECELKSDCDSVVPASTEQGEACLTDVSEMSSKRSYVKTQKKQKRKKSKREMKRGTENMRVHDVDSSQEFVKPVSLKTKPRESIATGKSSTKCGKIRKDKDKISRKRTLESETDTSIPNKKAKMQDSCIAIGNKQIDSAPKTAAKEPIPNCETSTSIVAGSEAPAPRKRRVSSSLKKDFQDSQKLKSNKKSIKNGDQDQVSKKQEKPVVNAVTQLSALPHADNESSQKPQPAQLTKNAALEKLLEDNKHLSAVKYLSSLFNGILTAKSPVTQDPLCSNSLNPPVVEGNQNQNTHNKSVPPPTSSNTPSISESLPSKSATKLAPVNQASLNLQSKNQNKRTSSIYESRQESPSSKDDDSQSETSSGILCYAKVITLK